MTCGLDEYPRCSEPQFSPEAPPEFRELVPPSAVRFVLMAFAEVMPVTSLNLPGKSGRRSAVALATSRLGHNKRSNKPSQFRRSTRQPSASQRLTEPTETMEASRPSASAYVDYRRAHPVEQCLHDGDPSSRLGTLIGKVWRPSPSSVKPRHRRMVSCARAAWVEPIGLHICRVVASLRLLVLEAHGQIDVRLCTPTSGAYRRVTIA
jgi:hypothetical protein